MRTLHGEPTELTTVNLVEQLQAGNTNVFEQVYYEYHERLFGYVINRTSSADLAEEVVQQAFIKLWEHRGKLSATLPVGIQLARITRTTMIDCLRQRAAHRKLTGFIATQVSESIHEERLLEKELDERIRSAVDNLPPSCKKIFILSRDEGFSHKEIAQRLSISPRTVENQLSKALKIVREVATLFTIMSIIDP